VLQIQFISTVPMHNDEWRKPWDDVVLAACTDPALDNQRRSHADLNMQYSTSLLHMQNANIIVTTTLVVTQNYKK